MHKKRIGEKDYFYTSVRDKNGKVETVYLGSNKKVATKKAKSLGLDSGSRNRFLVDRFNLQKSMYAFLVVFLIFFVILGIRNLDLTGFVVDEIDDSVDEGVVEEEVEVEEEISEEEIIEEEDSGGGEEAVVEVPIVENETEEEEVNETVEVEINETEVNETEEIEINETVGIVEEENITDSGGTGISGNFSEVNVSEINVSIDSSLNLTNETFENITSLNVTGNLTMNITDSYSNVTINSPVKWKKSVKLSEESDNLTIEIDFSAEDISVYEIDGGKEIEIDIDDSLLDEESNLITGDVVFDVSSFYYSFVGFFKSLFLGNPTGYTVLDEEGEIIELIIEEAVEELKIEYYLPGPIAVEFNLSESSKQIVVSSDIHYENILTYTEIQDVPLEAINLYWIVDNERVDQEFDGYDTNENGLVDYIEWMTPSLSNQTYEVEITVLNVQSYPFVGGNWTVRFNTTGVADLVVRAIGGTEWSNVNDTYDLKFLELNCGTESLNYSWINDSVFIGNYDCNETGYEVSNVFTEGAHHLELQFGEYFDYANNTAFNYSLGGVSAFEKNGSATSPMDYDTQATDEDYASINKSDNTRWSTSLAANDGEIESQIFIFNTSYSNISSLTVVWEGYGEQIAGYFTNLSVWNWTGQYWYQLNSTDFIVSKDKTISVNITSGSTSFFNSTTKQVAVLVTTEKAVTADCGNGVIEGDEECDSTQLVECRNSGWFTDNYVWADGTCQFEYACKSDCTACFDQMACDSICFTAGTKITMADGGLRDIEDVKVGEMVMTMNMDTMEPEPNKVLDLASPIHEDIVYLVFENSENKNTFDHPYYVKGKGWSSYKPEWTKERYGLDSNQLEVGDICYQLDENFELKESELLSIEEEWGEVQTYNLMNVENNNNFFANGMLVHNKRCAYLFSEDDAGEHFEDVTLGVFEEPGNVYSEQLTDRMFIENEGYSYLNLDKHTNKFRLVIPPHEIDYIDFLGLKVIDSKDGDEIVHDLSLVWASEGFDLLVVDDGERFVLDGETRYPHTLNLTFEELPELVEGYDRKVQLVEKGYYEAFLGSSIWYDFAPFNQTKWRNWLDMNNNYAKLRMMIDDLIYDHFLINGEHSDLFEERMGNYLEDSSSNDNTLTDVYYQGVEEAHNSIYTDYIALDIGGEGIFFAPTDPETANYTATGSVDGVLTDGTMYSTSQIVNFTHPIYGNRVQLYSNFNRGEVNLAGLKINSTETKTVVNITNVTGVDVNHTLYVPVNSRQGVYVCPDANIIDDVYDTCANAISFTYAEAVSGTRDAGVLAEIEGDYYKVSNVTGSGGGESNVTCGQTITTNVTMANDIVCTGHGINIGAHGVILDCNGHSLTGDNGSSANGIYTNSWDNVTIKNCRIDDFSYGIYVYYSQDFWILNNEVNDSSASAFRTYGHSSVPAAHVRRGTIDNNTFRDSTSYEMYLYNYILDSNFTNNVMTGSTSRGIFMYAGYQDNNLFVNNSIEIDTTSYRYGIYMYHPTVTFSNLTFINNTITTAGTGQYAVLIYPQESSGDIVNILFDGLNVKTSGSESPSFAFLGYRSVDKKVENFVIQNSVLNSTSYGAISYYGNTSTDSTPDLYNNYVIDTIIDTSGGSANAIYFIDYNASHVSPNNITFINVTNIDGELDWSAAGDGFLFMNHYFDVQANFSNGTPANNSNVSLWDVNYGLEFSEFTDVNGMTTKRRNITEYNMSNDNQRTAFGLHNLNTTTFTSDYANNSDVVNITGGYLLHNVTFNLATADVSPPNISYKTPTPNASGGVKLSSFAVNVTVIDNVGVNNITIYLFNGSNNVQINHANFNGSSILFNNFTSLNDGNYTFNATTYDTSENINYTETVEIIIDTVLPTFTWETPTPGDGETVIVNDILLNTTVNDETNTSAFYDWNYSLVGYWNFELFDASWVYDNSTYDNKLSYSGGFSEESVGIGKFGKGGYFSINPISGLTISDPVDNSLDIENGSATIMFWARMRPTGTWQLPLWKGGSAAATAGYDFEVNSVGGVNFNINNGSGDGSSYVSVSRDAGLGDLRDNEWHHYVGVVDREGVLGAAQKMYMFIDGNEQAEVEDASDCNNASSTNDLWIGRSSSTSYPVNGTIDEIMIVKRALTREEINATYNNGLYRLNTSFIDVHEGKYDYSAYVVDIGGNLEREDRTVTYSDPAASCGDTLTIDTVLNVDLECPSTALFVDSGVTLDCAGHTINYSYNGVDAGYGVNSTFKADGINIKNCNFVEGDPTVANKYAIHRGGGSGGNISNNSVVTSGSGSNAVYLNACPYINLTNNTLVTGNSIAVTFSSSSYSTIRNNNLDSGGLNAHSFYIYRTSSYNLFRNNLIISSGGNVFSFDADWLLIPKYNNITNNTILASTKEELYFHDTGIDYTHLIDQPINNYSFAGLGSRLHILEDVGTDGGEIWYGAGINGSGANLSSDIVIDNNNIYVNGSGKPGLNKSATLTFYDVTGITGTLRSYREDVACLDLCTNVTDLGGDDYRFKTQLDTDYSIGNNTVPPVPFLNLPPSGNDTTDRTPEFSWVIGPDLDGDSITFNFIMDDNETFNAPEVNVTDISSTTYTPISDLDVDTMYFWKVRSYDGYDYSEYTSFWNLTIDSYVAISLPVNSVDFGSITRDVYYNTSDDTPTPFLVQNDGNSLVNITLYATGLFDTAPLPSWYYQCKAGDSTEIGAFNSTFSLTDWTNITGQTSPLELISLLQYQDINDSAEVEIQIKAPVDEGAGFKTSTITFMGNFSE